MTVRVAMWSGPRNISTAMMRAWENRPDTVVVDEPFYAAYLARDRDRPPRPRRGDRLPADRPGGGGARTPGARGRRRALRQADDAPPLPTTPTWPGSPTSATCCWCATRPRWWRRTSAPGRPASPTTSACSSRCGCSTRCPRTPPVIDAGDFLRGPEAHLRWLCDWLGIAFTDRMLHWPAGPAGERRRLGAVLVRRRGALDRLRAVATARGRPLPARRRGRRGLPPGVRRPPRAAAPALTAPGRTGTYWSHARACCRPRHRPPRGVLLARLPGRSSGAAAGHRRRGRPSARCRPAGRTERPRRGGAAPRGRVHPGPHGDARRPVLRVRDRRHASGRARHRLAGQRLGPELRTARHDPGAHRRRGHRDHLAGRPARAPGEVPRSGTSPAPPRPT